MGELIDLDAAREKHNANEPIQLGAQEATQPARAPGEDYAAFFLRDLSHRMVLSEAKGGHIAEPIQSEYERLSDADKAAIQKWIDELGRREATI